MIGLIFSMFVRIRRRSMTMWRDGDGVVAVIVAVTLPVLVAFSALAIDMSYAYWTRAQLQHAASAAALAGAGRLSEAGSTVGEVKLEAIEYADKNLDPASHGTTLLASDVTLGNWNPDPDNRTFTPLVAPDESAVAAESGVSSVGGNACANPQPVESNPNCLEVDAVEVTTCHREQGNDNALNLFLAGAVGMAQTDICTEAIAWAYPGPPPPLAGSDCFQEGMLAGNNVILQSNNDFINGFCIYGRCEVSIEQGNSFQATQTLLDASQNPILDDNGDEIPIPGTQVAVGPENGAGCAPWAPSDYPGLDVDSPGAENCGLLGENDGGVCDPPQCGDLSESLAACAWQGYWPEGDSTPPPTPELAEYWTAHMFPNIQDVPSMTTPLSTDSDLGAITSVDFSAFTSPPVAVTQADLDDIFADATAETCQTQQGGVYILTDTADLPSDKKICNVVINAGTVTAGSGITLDNVALVAGDSGNTTNEAIIGADISFGSNYSINHVLLVARDKVTLGGGVGSSMGDASSCGGSVPTVQLFALGDLFIASDVAIFNGDIVAAGSVNLGSNAEVNLTGNGTTIQALGDITVQSNGQFGACPEELIADANDDSVDPNTATVYRLVH